MRLDELVEMISGVCAGQPVVKGTRLPVKFIYAMLDQGWSPEEIVKFHYPFLSLELVKGLVEHREAIEALIRKWEENWRRRVEAFRRPEA